MNLTKPIESLILTMRGRKVLLDSDLAGIYGVPTKRLNEQVKRNQARFPEDFLFQLTPEEYRLLQSAPSLSDSEGSNLKSQSATSSHGGRRRLPWAFTEHGAIMAASVVNSPEAVQMSVFVVRAFIQMREQLAANASILKRMAEIDKTLLEHDQTLQVIWHKLQPLLQPPPDPPKRRIGFRTDENLSETH